MSILQCRGCHLCRARGQPVFPTNLPRNFRHLWPSGFRHCTCRLLFDQECSASMQSLPAANGWKKLLRPARWLQLADMALPPRKVLHRHRPLVCSNRIDNIRLPVRVLRLHATVVQSAWQPADPPQWGECEDQDNLARILARLRRWASHWELRAH